jgi:hypothetical protein
MDTCGIRDLIDELGRTKISALYFGDFKHPAKRMDGAMLLFNLQFGSLEVPEDCSPETARCDLEMSHVHLGSFFQSRRKLPFPLM